MSILRTPSAPDPSPTPVVESQGEVVAGNEVVTPGVYESKNGKPYLAKVYDAETAWSRIDSETKDQADVINEYFKELSVKGEYRTDDTAYRDYLRKYEKITDTKNAPLEVKLKKIGEFIRYLKRTQ